MEHTAPDGTGIFILEVEDSRTQAEEIRFFLENKNYEVKVCYDGREALTWLQRAERRPDVVISDIQMPRMDGYELCKAIRSDEQLKDLPVILLTSLSDPADIIQSIESGANKFLTKPFDPLRLPGVVNELYINTKRRDVERMETGIRLLFGGKEFLITADRIRILDLLLSSYEETYYHNLQLQEARSALETLNAELELKVQARTRELREQKELFRTLAEHLPDLVVRFDRSRQLVYANQAVEKLMNIPRNDLIGQPVENLEHLFVSCSCSEQLNAIFQTGVEQRDEYSFMKTTDLKWLDATFVPEYNEQGDISFALNVSRDITESKKAQEALRDNQRYLKSLLDSQPNIVIINDGEQLIETNREFFKFFSQYDSLEAFRKEHKCICEFFEPSERPNFLLADMEGKNWIEVLKAHPFRFYKAKISREGKEQIFSVRLETALANGVERNIVSFCNITEMEYLQRDLESKVVEEVEKRRLKEQQLLEQSKIVQMGEMITNISHHWRQPLNLIAVSTQDLLDAYTHDEMDQDYLENTVRKTMETVTKMSEIINTFREFMVEKSDRKQFNPADAVRRTLEILRPGMEEYKITLNVNLAEDTVSFGNPGRLEQTLYQLLTNAQEALLERKIDEGRIDLSLYKNEDGTILLTVQDNAGGIDEKVLPRIFEPFFTTKELATKTGTGLYFAKIFVEKELDGMIIAENRENGACLSIQLPPLENRIDNDQPIG